MSSFDDSHFNLLLLLHHSTLIFRIKVLPSRREAQEVGVYLEVREFSICFSCGVDIFVLKQFLGYHWRDAWHMGLRSQISSAHHLCII